MIFSMEKHSQIYFYLAMLFCFILPFHSGLAALMLILMILNFLSAGSLVKILKHRFTLIPIASSLWFLWYCISISYSENLWEGIHDVETKLSFLVLPIMLFTLPFFNKEQFQKIQWAFVFGNISAALFCILMATLTYFKTGKLTFHYSYLANYVGSHPSYFGAYFILTFFIITNYLFQHWKALRLQPKIIGIGTSIFALVFILMLSARMVLLSFIVLVLVSLFHLIVRKISIFQTIGITSAALIGLVAICLLIPATNVRIQATINNITQKTEGGESKDIRIRIWTAASFIIKENPMLGVGCGDIQHELKAVYQRKGYKEAFEKNFNTHNQYLQTWVATGCIGFVLLMLIVFPALILAYRKKQFIPTIFFSLFILTMLTESNLERQQGVLFFAFFSSLYSRSMLIKDQKEESSTPSNH